MGPQPRGMFNNSLTLYAVGQGLIYFQLGVTAAGFASGARFELSAALRGPAAFVILAMGGHGNQRRFGKGYINPGLSGPIQPGRKEYSFPLTV